MPTALLLDTDADGSHRWLHFDRPRRVLVARRLDEVATVLDAVADAAEQGLWAVGYLAYEAAPAVDPTLPGLPPDAEAPPLAWWALFDQPSASSPTPRWAATADLDRTTLDWRPQTTADEHRARVEAVREHIAAGDTYQANLTFPLVATIDPSLDPLDLFARLQTAQQAPYAAYLDLDSHALVSVSPELFFEQDGDHLRSRPMKGTARRGRFPSEDAERKAELRSVKNRAENVMIVDMIRNDLGRVARPGTVVVDRLFAEETYPTVHQLVSDVRAETDADPVAVLRALFPCASITGAPKRRTMELLGRLEERPRGVYTGAIGRIGPSRRARLSVAIRTVTVDRRHRRATYGVGGGIVWDSNAEDEWHECRTKARVLGRRPHRFELLETLRWQPRSGYFLLDRHLDRLVASARFFDFRCRRESLRERLLDATAHLDRRRAGRHRVRLRLSRDGEARIDIESFPCAGRQTWNVLLDDRPVDDQNPQLFHKTTDRSIYDEALARHPAADEVLLFNPRGHLTEGTRTNLVLRFGDRFLTPPIASGLLAGTYRGALVDRGRLHVAELPIR
ncbi:MAG: aminodeoxychorismate synthase component I, partial [Acidobacteriota bacterium]